MSRAIAGFALLGVTGCPAPGDVTPIIHVDPRAAQRLAWFSEPAAVEEPAPPSAARVHVMKGGEQLGGREATGRPGDVLLENAQVVFVIGQIDVDAGADDSGGDLIDAADAHLRKDDLGRVVATLGTTPPTAVYRTLRSGTDAEDGAWVEASTRGLTQPTLTATTRYTLRAPDRAVLMETTLENAGEAPVEVASVGDRIEWGAGERVAPGEARGFVGASNGPYVGAVGMDASYALTSTDGSIEATSGGSWTQTAQRRNVTLAAHERTTYARIFVVGARADTASLVGELALAAGQPVGEVKVTVPGGTSGTTLTLRLEGSGEPLTMVEPFEAMLPEGRYRITPLEGRRPSGPLVVKSGRTATATMASPIAPPLAP
jgi:hypothetical protein